MWSSLFCLHHSPIGDNLLFVTKDTGYPHDGCTDKDSYPHDRRADKDSYPYDRHKLELSEDLTIAPL